jgi:hypothetical protein
VRKGKRISYSGFYKAWKRAVHAAGVARVPHDFRRTAIRNLERDGVPRSVAMAMVGQKTEEVYRRYAIVDEAMIREAAIKMNRGAKARQETARRAAASASSVANSQQAERSGDDQNSAAAKSHRRVTSSRGESPRVRNGAERVDSVSAIPDT